MGVFSEHSVDKEEVIRPEKIVQTRGSLHYLLGPNDETVRIIRSQSLENLQSSVNISSTNKSLIKTLQRLTKAILDLRRVPLSPPETENNAKTTSLSSFV